MEYLKESKSTPSVLRAKVGSAIPRRKKAKKW
jgi:hypothetical protein